MADRTESKSTPTESSSPIRREIAIRCLAFLAMVSAGSACTTVKLEGAVGEESPRTYFGVVTVLGSNEKHAAGVRRLEIRTIGLRFQSGMSLGYIRETALALPADCRLVVLVRSPAEVHHAAEILKSMKDGPCIATLHDQDS